MGKKVLLGMSGGIDSTVSAMLLLEQGYEVVGVTFRTYDSMKESCIAKEKGCCTIDSIMEAKHNAERMGFEHHIVDFRDTFKRCVIQNFIDEYMSGRTPNPCVICNSTIKWGEMLRLADEMSCDYIATGHYARIAERDGHVYLRTAADSKKDQTYFLWMLTEENLRRTIFPLGDLQKTEVRQLAAAHGFKKLSEKRESQEICFIPDNDYRTFLASEGLIVEKGVYVDADGNRLGEHEGYCNYTIGQRKGLGIALGKPCFVTRIDAATNTVQLGSHDDLLTNRVDAGQIRVRDPQWLKNDPEADVQIRYRSKAVHARLQIDGTHLTAFTYEPVWGVTPGQSLVVYKEGMVVAGGII